MRRTRFLVPLALLLLYAVAALCWLLGRAVLAVMGWGG